MFRSGCPFAEVQSLFQLCPLISSTHMLGLISIKAFNSSSVILELYNKVLRRSPNQNAVALGGFLPVLWECMSQVHLYPVFISLPSEDSRASSFPLSWT